MPNTERRVVSVDILNGDVVIAFDNGKIRSIPRGFCMKCSRKRSAKRSIRLTISQAVRGAPAPGSASLTVDAPRNRLKLRALQIVRPTRIRRGRESTPAKFEYGDLVVKRDDSTASNSPCSVVAITPITTEEESKTFGYPVGTTLYTVEFGDGSDTLLPEDDLAPFIE